MEQPVRKTNRLRAYNYSSGGAYFITICTTDVVLSNIVARDFVRPEVRLTSVGEIIEKNIKQINRAENVFVDHYVIMPDHVHMIIYINDTTGKKEKGQDPANERIPQVVSAFKRYSQKDVGRRIFQRGYYDHIIRNDKDYDVKWQYIDDNPANWLQKKKWQEEKKRMHLQENT